MIPSNYWEQLTAFWIISELSSIQSSTINKFYNLLYSMPSTPKSLDYKRWPNYKAGVALGVCTVKRENWLQNEWLSKDCPLVGLWTWSVHIWSATYYHLFCVSGLPVNSLQASKISSGKYS